MTILTNPITPSYATHSLAQASDGFRSSGEQNIGAIAPSNFLGVFLVLAPKGFPLVVCGGNSQELPVIADGVPRSTNLSRTATILFRSIWCQLVLNQNWNIIMQDSIFQIRPDIEPARLFTALLHSTAQAQALNASLGDLLANHNKFQNYQHFAQAANSQWALAELLERQGMIAERLDRVSPFVSLEKQEEVEVVS